jgi:hypothetical protein
MPGTDPAISVYASACLTLSSRYISAPRVIVGHFLPPDIKERDRNVQKNVQNIAYRPRSHSLFASPFLWWRVNIGEEMWALYGRVRASKGR